MRAEEERKEAHRVVGGMERAVPRKENTEMSGVGAPDAATAAAASAVAVAAVQGEVAVGASGRRGFKAPPLVPLVPVVVSTPGGTGVYQVVEAAEEEGGEEAYSVKGVVYALPPEAGEAVSAPPKGGERT